MTKARLLEKGRLFSNRDLAEWFGVTKKTMDSDKKRKLQELDKFCSYEDYQNTGYLLIKEVYYPIYTKSINSIIEALKIEIEKTHRKGNLISYRQITANGYKDDSNCYNLARKLSLDYYKENRTFVPCRLNTVYYTLEALDKETVMKYMKDIAFVSMDFWEDNSKAIGEVLRNKGYVQEKYGNDWVYEAGYLLK